jgi:DNA polymerase III epsilon subunit-like protein
MKSLQYAILDTETTGLSPDARIVEAAVIHLDPSCSTT